MGGGLPFLVADAAGNILPGPPDPPRRLLPGECFEAVTNVYPVLDAAGSLVAVEVEKQALQFTPG